MSAAPMPASSSLEAHIPRLDAGFDAMEESDVEGFMALVTESMHPDVEFVSAVGSMVEGRSYVGHEGVRAWARDILGAMTITYEEREYRILGSSRILFLAKPRVQGQGSGAELTTEIATIFQYENGLCVRCESFASHAEAIAVGERDA